MGIWFRAYTVDELNERGSNTLSDFMDIQFTDIQDDSLTATMPVNSRSRQPIGILHGGANVVLAETLASTAANMVIDINSQYCVGLEINANHVRSVREGLVTAIARPLHLGRSTQLWDIKIYDESQRLTCVSRMTASVLNRKAK